MMSSSAAALPRIEFREALLLAFFAALIVLARGGLRWHLHVPGHAMFATVLFLILARGWVPRAGAASLTGLAAGIGWAVAGTGGPLAAMDLLLPAVVVDAAAALPLSSLPSALRWAGIGALAGAAGFLPAAGRELLAGTPGPVLLRHPLLAAVAKAGFGALGGGAAAAVLGRLRARGIPRGGRSGASGERQLPKP
jgi:hypothetical protein